MDASGKVGPLRTHEPKLWLAQDSQRILLLHDFYNIRQGGGHHEEDILPSISFSPVPVLTPLCSGNQHSYLSERFTPGLLSFLMFCTVILTEIWEPSCLAKKITSFLCISLHEREGGERRGEDLIRTL